MDDGDGGPDGGPDDVDISWFRIDVDGDDDDDDGGDGIGVGINTGIEFNFINFVDGIDVAVRPVAIKLSNALFISSKKLIEYLVLLSAVCV
jgi:hypothetical protein